jgi:hypothetical protein
VNRTPLVLLTAFLIVAACSRPGIKGDGVIKTETRSIADFSTIIVTGHYEIQWSSGKPALSLEVDQNLLALLKTEVSGDTLRIDSAEKVNPTRPIVLVLSSSSLAEIQIAGHIVFKAGRLAGDKFKIDAAGQTAISVEGSVTTLAANLVGDSKLDAKMLQTKFADLSMVGSSNADVTVASVLTVSIIGDGTCTYGGNPPTIEKSGIGSANVRPRP